MSKLQFPKNPAVGQQYDFPPYRYYWDGIKWKTMGIGYNPVNDLRDEVLPTTREALRRSCAEVGLTLVAGSFEEGATVTLKTEVVWQQATGKVFAWFQNAVKTVGAGSTPSTAGGVGAGAWVDRTDVSLRREINSQLNVVLNEANEILRDAETARNDAVAAAAGMSSAIVGKATRADLNTSLAFAEGTIGYVTNDPTPANNGYYRKTGASGSGSWVQSSYDRVVAVENRLNRYFVSFFGDVIVDKADGVVRYPQMAVMRNGEIWKELYPMAYSLTAFELPFRTTPINDFHYIDVSLIGTATNPVKTRTIAEIPQLGENIVPLGTTLSNQYNCFWASDIIYTDRPAIVQNASLTRPIFIDRAGRLGGGAAVYVPKVGGFCIHLPQIDVSGIAAVTNSECTELAGYVKFALSSTYPDLVHSIYYDSSANVYAMAVYVSVPEGAANGFVPMVYVWHQTFISPLGLRVIEYDSVIQENQFPYGKGSNFDLMPRKFGNTTIVDITEPNLLALGFTRGAADLQASNRPYVGMNFSKFIPGTRSFFRCYVETDTANTYSIVQVYFWNNSTLFGPICLTKEADLSANAAVFSGSFDTPSQADIVYFLVGVDSQASAAKFKITGIQFHNSLKACYNILKDDYPSPSQTSTASDIASRDAANIARSNAYKTRIISNVQKPTAKYNTKIVYGQSLGRGQETWPALSRTNRFNNKMLGGNVLPNTHDGANYSTFGRAALVDLFAQSVDGATQYTDAQESALSPGNGAFGEPVNHGWVNFSKHLHNQEALTENDASRLFVTFNPSVSGRTIEQLSKVNTQDATDRYSRFTDGLTKIETASGVDSHVVDGIMWMQGEWNYYNNGGSRNKATYKTLFGTLIDNMIADCKTITGQTQKPAFFTYQTGAEYTSDVDSAGNPGLHVGMAQLETSLEKDGVFMVGPVYPYTDKGGHLDSNGSRWYGHQIAKVYHRVVRLGEDWEPLRPIKITQDVTVIYIDFHVPEAPLVFDLPYVVNNAVDYSTNGFKVTDASGTVAISSVEIVGNTIVKINLSRATSGSVFVWYASQTTSGNGCLRDSDSTVALDNYVYEPERGMYASANIPALVNKPYLLHNWCVAFYLPVGYDEA